MNQQTTLLSGLKVIVTAHRSENESLLLVSLKADEPAEALPRTPARVAIVIDRSGSMSGEKIEITKLAVAQFIRSLSPDDQVSLVTYDEKVVLVCGLETPSEGLALRVESIQPGGSTNLYGGWVTGAKVVGRGGRVILLSDGHANVGPITDAHSLCAHAARTYEKFGVTTTTIGVGRDYDEGLMAGMARAGGGSHYFAHAVSAIADAFSQERFSSDAIVLEGVSVRCDGVTEQLGHFWGGETKKRIFKVADLTALKASVRYTERSRGLLLTENLSLPTDFGYSEEVRLEYLMQQASEAEGEMLGVRDPNSAGQKRERLRAIVLVLLSHPSSDKPLVISTIDRLKASIERLEALERNYIEEDAMMHRKRSMQSSHNLRERAQGFSSFEEEKEFVSQSYLASSGKAMPSIPIVFTYDALQIAPFDQWIRWEALPIQVQPQLLIVALEDPRRGIVLSEIKKVAGREVRAVFAGMTSAEIAKQLKIQSFS